MENRFKKAYLIMMAMILILSTMISVPVFADPVTDDLSKMMFSKAAKASAAPIIDGEKDAAYGNTAVLTPKRWKQNKISGVSGQFNVLWDSEDLYVYADVTDSTVNTENAQTWERDSIEIFIEEDNERKDIYGDGDHQIRIMADGEIWMKSTLLTTDDVDVAYDITDTGYVIEARISVKTIILADGRTIGFDCQINDADTSTYRVGLIGWNDYQDNAGKYPKDMGQLQLTTGIATNADTILIDYPMSGPAIPPVDFSSQTTVGAGQVKLETYESTAPLLNPDKGWVLYGNPSAYGIPNLQTDETLALGTTGYYRFSWYEIEPEEGQYRWDIIDDVIAAWAARGKKFAFGVMNANTARPNIRYVTPQWVEEAGAQFKEVDITFNLDAGVTGTQMVPVWNDPIFMKKLDNFVKALGAKYNNDPRVAFIDVRSYGNFGESSVAGLSESSNPDKRSIALSDADYQRHIDIYKKYFPNKQLFVARGTVAHELLYKDLPNQDVGLRFDGVITGHPFYLAEASPKVPTAYEFVASYEQMKRENQWTDYAFYKSFTQGYPSYIGMGQYYTDASLFISEKRQLIEEASNLIGYHFVLNDIILPKAIDAGTSVEMTFNWCNKGFAPIYKDTHIALAIMDQSNNMVDKYWLDDLNAKGWLPRTVNEGHQEITLNNIANGTYKLAVGIFKDTGDSNPTYGIGNRCKLPGNWYMVTDSVTVSENTYTFAGIEQIPINVIINNSLQAYVHQPVLSGGTALLPVKETFEALGAVVSLNGNSITVTPGSGDAFVLTIGMGGVSDINGIAMIEADKVEDYFDAMVDWNPETSTVKILNKVVEKEFTASHEWLDGSNSLREAKLAFDGNKDTSWVADKSYDTITPELPVWIQRSFADPITFNSVKITESAAPTAGEIGSFKIQYWKDGAWKDAYTGTKVSTAEKGGTYTFDFASVTSSKIRLLVTSATIGFVNVREIEIVEPEFMASHQWIDSSNTLREARLAFDGNMNTSWVADKSYGLITSDSPVWIQRNFVNPKTFNSVKITESAAPTAGEIGDFKIQYWNDGVWQDAYTGTKVSTGEKGDTYIYTFAPVTITQFRLLVTSATVGYVNVREIEVIEYQEPEFMASHEYNAYTAEKAFDGNMGTRLIINFSAGAVKPETPVWIQRNYAEPITFTGVKIVEYEDPASTLAALGNFKIQYWNNGWQDAYMGEKVSTGVKGETYTYTFTPVTTTKFRLLVTSATGGGWLSVKEIELIEAAVETPILQTVNITGNTSMTEGEIQALTVTGTMSNGNTANLAGADISYSSSESNVANVNVNTGVVTANAPGTAVITTEVTMGDVTTSAGITITVSALPEFMASHTYVPTDGRPADTFGAVKAFDGNTTGSSRWISGIYTPNVNMVTPVWIQRSYAAPITFNSVKIMEHAGDANLGDLGAFKIQYWSNGWQDAYTGAKVSTGEKGVFYEYTFAPVTTTKFRLLVTSASGAGGFQSIREIEIIEAAVETPILHTVSIAGNTSMTVGDTQTLTIAGFMDDGSPVDLTTATGAAISYSSSNSNVASVDEITGVVIANAEGTTDIVVSVTMGSAAATASFRVTVEQEEDGGEDRMPPDKPEGLTASNVNMTSLTLTWLPSTDNAGVTGYEIYRNGQLVQTVTGTICTVTGLSAGTAYSFTVVAVDESGLKSQASDTLEITTVAEQRGDSGNSENNGDSGNSENNGDSENSENNGDSENSGGTSVIPQPVQKSVKASELQAAIVSGADYTVAVKDENGKVVYSWTFTKQNLKLANVDNLADIKLDLTVTRLDANTEINDLLTWKNKQQTGLVISFEQEGILPVQASVRIYVRDLGIEKDTILYLYYYNPETGKLDVLPYTSKGFQVDKDGYITINIIHCSDYVLLPNKADTSTYTDSLAQIVLSPAKVTLYTGGTSYSKSKIKVTMPSTFELVKSLKDETSGTAVGAVTITYKSSNTKVATVNSNGAITAKGKGTAKITAAVKLYSGLTKTFTTSITVKEPSITISKKTAAMKLGSTYTFEATVAGYDKNSLVWMTSKKDVVVINKKTGKAMAKTKGTDYVEAGINGKIVKFKVVVK